MRRMARKRTAIGVAAGTMLGVLAAGLVVACTTPSATGSAAIDPAGSGALATAAAPERAESGSGGAAAPRSGCGPGTDRSGRIGRVRFGE